MTDLLHEHVVPGKRLGRHVFHDPRSLSYPFAAPTVEVASVRWSADSDPILDQGNVGSCTGNATVGSLLCSLGVLHKALSPEQAAGLNEHLALQIYSLASQTDPFPGAYPNQDTGSDGLDAAKAAVKLGLISGYSHALSFQAFLQALATAPVIAGIQWMSTFDNPGADGLVSYGGYVRGGHEICFDEIDVEHQIVWFRNSWTDQWGLKGRAYMPYDTVQKLLANQGDVTVLAPLTAPQPQPVPTPKRHPVDTRLIHAFETWKAAKGYPA